MLLWTLDPAERDALLLNEAARKWHHSNNVIVEIACTRSSEELFAIRRAYHARYKRSLEEDVAAYTSGDFRKVIYTCQFFKFHSIKILILDFGDRV